MNGAGCPGRCFDSPTTTSTATTVEESAEEEEETSSEDCCYEDDKKIIPFFRRKEMLVIYGILMCMPLIIWFTEAPINFKMIVTLVLLITVSLYFSFVLVPRYKKA